MEERPEKKKEILIIDDETEFTAALRAVLQSDLCDVFVATCLAEAQQAVRTSNPSLVILGTMGERGEAFALLKWLRDNPKTIDVPVIVMDAPAEKKLVKGWRRDEAVLMDAEDYISKPVEPGALAARAQTILERSIRHIRVMIVDDHSVVRDGVKSLLDLQKDIKVVGQAENGKDALEKVGMLSPDVVIMDIVMPEMNGLEATRKIYEEHPQTRVVMLSQYDDEDNILAAEQLGAYGFIPKRAASAQLVNAIRAVHYLGKRLQRPTPGPS